MWIVLATHGILRSINGLAWHERLHGRRWRKQRRWLAEGNGRRRQSLLECQRSRRKGHRRILLQLCVLVVVMWLVHHVGWLIHKRLSLRVEIAIFKLVLLPKSINQILAKVSAHRVRRRTLANRIREVVLAAPLLLIGLLLHFKRVVVFRIVIHCNLLIF